MDIKFEAFMQGHWVKSLISFSGTSHLMGDNMGSLLWIYLILQLWYLRCTYQSVSLCFASWRKRTREILSVQRSCSEFFYVAQMWSCSDGASSSPPRVWQVSHLEVYLGNIMQETRHMINTRDATQTFQPIVYVTSSPKTVVAQKDLCPFINQLRPLQYFRSLEWCHNETLVWRSISKFFFFCKEDCLLIKGSMIAPTGAPTYYLANFFRKLHENGWKR